MKGAPLDVSGAPFISYPQFVQLDQRVFDCAETSAQAFERMIAHVADTNRRAGNRRHSSANHEPAPRDRIHDALWFDVLRKANGRHRGRSYSFARKHGDVDVRAISQLP